MSSKQVRFEDKARESERRIADAAMKRQKQKEKEEARRASGGRLSAADSAAAAEAAAAAGVEAPPEEDNKTLKVITDLARRLREGRRRTRVKIDTDWDSIIRTRNEHLLCFSMIGLATSVVLSYYKWAERCWIIETGGHCNPAYIGNVNATLHIATVSNTEDHYQVTQFFIILGQAVLSFSTVVCIRVLAQLYGLHLTERRRAWSGLDEIDLINDDGTHKPRQKQFKMSYKFIRSSLKWLFIIELLVHLFHPIVFLETAGPAWETVYEVSQSFIFLRLYLVLRVLYINSRVYKHREEIISSNRELRETGYEISMPSTAKILFYKNPSLVVLSMTVAAVAVLGFWMFVTERDNNPAFESLWDCYWFVWVSISTIGYGDMSAITTTGRIIVLVIAVMSLFITTVFAGIVTNLLSPTREQRLVSSYLAQHEAQARYTKNAGVLIFAALDEKRRNKDKPKGLGTRRSPAMYAAIKEFRESRLKLRESLGAAADPVMDTKLMDSLYDASELNAELERQWRDIAEVEESMLQAVAFIKRSVKETSMRTTLYGTQPNPPPLTSPTAAGGGAGPTPSAPASPTSGPQPPRNVSMASPLL